MEETEQVINYYEIMMMINIKFRDLVSSYELLFALSSRTNTAEEEYYICAP